jgi:hypothetical protein
MVFTASQTTLFFESPDQMGLANATVVQLQKEGITTVSDLADFGKYTIMQIAANPAFFFLAKSQERLIVATHLVRYYQTVGRPLSAENMAWNTTMKNFKPSWEALIHKSNKDAPETPKSSKALTVIKWTSAFSDHLHRVFGVRKIPLAYVIRPSVLVEDIALYPLASGYPYSTKLGSVEDELIHRASHTHALFREDNQAVYFLLEEATRSTPYAATWYHRWSGVCDGGGGAWYAALRIAR